MRGTKQWPWLVCLAAVVATLVVAAPVQADVRQYHWQGMALAQRVTAEHQLVVDDWRVITTWRLARHLYVHGGMLPIQVPAVYSAQLPAHVQWHMAHMAQLQARLKRDMALLAKQRAAAATAYPPHHALWVCIGGHEGSPTSVNPNGHYGMLQMTYNWFGLINGRASDYPQATQEWAAERAWAANHYSYSFLVGQWFRYDGASGCYHGS